MTSQREPPKRRLRQFTYPLGRFAGPGRNCLAARRVAVTNVTLRDVDVTNSLYGRYSGMVLGNTAAPSWSVIFDGVRVDKVRRASRPWDDFDRGAVTTRARADRAATPPRTNEELRVPPLHRETIEQIRLDHTVGLSRRDARRPGSRGGRRRVGIARRGIASPAHAAPVKKR